MNLTKRKILALDLGGVCVALGRRECMAALGFEGREDFPAAFDEPRRAFAEGRISADDWLDKTFELLGGRISKERILEAWSLIVGPPLPGMREAVAALVREGLSPVYFSDTNTLHIDYLRRRGGFLELGFGEIFSYDVGAEKPSAAMYEAFERKFGIPFFYTDDRRDNIDAALARGWPAARFTDAESFLREVRKKLENPDEREG
jgi:FMN phosphatase YigB (HAD superfamily)